MDSLELRNEIEQDRYGLIWLHIEKLSVPLLV